MARTRVRLAAELRAMVDADQAIRRLFLGNVAAEQPPTSAGQRGLYSQMLESTQAQALRLAAIVDELGGWPRPSEVGFAAAHGGARRRA